MPIGLVGHHCTSTAYASCVADYCTCCVCTEEHASSFEDTTADHLRDCFDSTFACYLWQHLHAKACDTLVDTFGNGTSTGHEEEVFHEVNAVGHHATCTSPCAIVALVLFLCGIVDERVYEHGFCGLLLLCELLTLLSLSVDAIDMLLCVQLGNLVSLFGHTVCKRVAIEGGSGQSMPQVIHVVILLILKQLNGLMVLACCGHELAVLLIVLIAKVLRVVGCGEGVDMRTGGFTCLLQQLLPHWSVLTLLVELCHTFSKKVVEAVTLCEGILQ